MTEYSLTEVLNVLLPLFGVLVATGGIAGILAGLLGVGGGIIIVPVLFTLLGLLDIDDSVRMHVSVGTSLASIVVTSVISARSHYKRGSVDMDVLKALAPAIFIGSIAGTAVAGYVDGPVLSLIFAVIAALVALYMLFTPSDFKIRDDLSLRAVTTQFSVSTIGGLSAMMGIGGGTLCVPYFNAFGFPVHRAIGTAAAIGLIVALPATIGFVISGWGIAVLPHASVGHVNLLGLILIAPFASLTAPLGVRLAHFLKPRTLKIAFAVFLLITVVRMVL